MPLSVYANNKLHKGQSNDAWSKLYDLIQSKSNVLDIGCSSGNFGTELIKTKGCTVTGIDINVVDLAIAKKHLNRVFLRDIERDTLEDLGSFDIILMADVIEHLIDPISALKKVQKQLTPAGKIIFSVPNMANFATRLELLEGRFEYTEYGLLDETHLHYYDRVELEKVLNKAGLHVVEYNNTIRDVPRRAAMQLLSKIGLTPAEKFWELANSIDSITFQFIGIAQKGVRKNSPADTKTPYDFVSAMIDDDLVKHKSETEKLRSDYEKLDQERNDLLAEKHRVEQELEAIHGSKSWRVISKVYAAKRKFKRQNH